MRATLRSRVLLAVTVWAGATAFAVPAAAQDSAEMGRAISTVINYRISWMDDRARFDACRVRQAMNGEEDFVSHIVEPVRELLDGPTAACPRPPRDPRDYTPVVLLDSLRFADTTARVYLTVLRGELEHREIYTLRRNNSSAAYMPVPEVRLWGHGRSYGGWPLPAEPDSSRSGSENAKVPPRQRAGVDCVQEPSAD